MKSMIKFAAAVTLAAGLAAGISAPSQAQDADTAPGATTYGLFGGGAALGGPNVPFRPPFVGSDWGNTNLGYGAYGSTNGYGAYGSANGYRAYGAVRPRYRAGYARGYVRSGYGAYGYSNPGYSAYGAAADTFYNGGDFNTGCETSGVMYGQLNDYSACASD